MVDLKVGEKYWIIVGSNGTFRLQLGKFIQNEKPGVNRFEITKDGFSNPYFGDAMLWHYEGEEVNTYDDKYVFEYKDLDKAYLKFLKGYGINILNLGVFIDNQISKNPENII